jgi:type III secretion protein U
MSDEKTEQPTDKKLEDAKKKGQHAKSQDLSAALGLLAITICLSAAAQMTIERVLAIVTRTLDHLGTVDGSSDLAPMMTADLIDGLLLMLPFIAVSVLVGIAGVAAQVGLGVSFEPVSVKTLVEFVKTLIKAIAMVAVIWHVINDLLPTLLGSVYLSPSAITVLGWGAVMKVLGGALLLYFAVGPLDFGLQKLLFLRDQRMSKDEVKREYKEMEGDPEIKGKRKELAREYATSAPKQTVPGATVVVTNPTHYAVALRYVPGVTLLPELVAKGADGEAMMIRRIAEEHGVPVISEPPLARALFKVEVGDVVPEPLFEAVAAVLRWVAVVKGPLA